MTHPDSLPGTTPPSDANLGTPLRAPTTPSRRALRAAAEAAAVAAREAEAAATREAEATATARAGEVVTPAPHPTRASARRARPAATPAEPVVLTRRQLRELAEREQAEFTARRQRTEQQQLADETRLQAEELADLEIAPLGYGPLEPALDLHLEPVQNPDEAPLGVDVPLHLATPTITPAPLAPTGTDLLPVVLSRRALRATERETTSTPAQDGTGPAAAPALATAAALATEATTDTPASRRALARTDAARTPRVGSRALPRPASAPGPAPRPATGTPRRRGWAKAGLSAVAMAFVVAMTAVTALPTTVSASPVDSNLVNLSLTASAAETQQLITASGSTAAVDRDGYGVSDAGELQAAGYSTAQLLVGRSLAQELVDAMDAGKLVGSQPDHMKEIRWIAQGVTVPDCGVDYRILEIIAIAVRNFDQVGVSDINRKCTGQIEGAGTSSSHYIDGGGHAVDFYLLDNKSLSGADAGTLKMISLLDPVMPVGARVGQASCRASAGVVVNLTNWTEFDDSCTHMHVDVPVSDAPLLLADNDALLSR